MQFLANPTSQIWNFFKSCNSLTEKAICPFQPDSGRISFPCVSSLFPRLNAYLGEGESWVKFSVDGGKGKARRSGCRRRSLQ